MRKLIATLLLLSFNTYAVPPVAVNGELSSNVYVQNVKTPNYQATKLAGLDTRLETGNTNLLINPSFEHLTVTTGWSATGISAATAEATNVVEGKQSLKLVLNAALSAYQDSTINASQLSGLQGVGSVKVKTSDVSGLQACVRGAGVTLTSLCVNIPADGTWKHIVIPFILSGTSNGVILTSTGTSGTVYVDDAFVGTSAPLQNVNGAQLIGTVSYAGIASCTFATSSTSFVSYTANASCNNATSTGSLKPPSTKIPGFILPAGSPAGTYRIVASGSFPKVGTVDGAVFYRFNDGTNSFGSGYSYVQTQNGGNGTFEGVINYSSSQASDTTIQIQGLSESASNSARVEIGGANYSLTFTVYYFPPQSKIFSQASQDYDWTAYTPTFTGFGTPTNVNCIHKRDGSDLLLNCLFNAGTTTATEFRVSLPNSLVALSTLPTISIAGQMKANSTNANNSGLNVLKEPSVGYVTFGVESTGNAGLTKTSSTAQIVAGVQYSFEARVPIQGWSDYGVIVGSFAGIEKCASDYECTDTFSAQVSAAGVVSNENIDWINGNCTLVTSTYTCTFNTTLKDGTSGLSSPMNCFVENAYTGSQSGSNFVNSSSTTNVVVQTIQGNTNTASAFNIKCQKASPDFKPKTAKVASSIGVPTVPGIVSTGTGNAVDTFSVSYAGSNAGNPASWTNCTTGTCNIDQIGTAVSTIVWNSAGSYTLNLSKTYSKLKCAANSTTVGTGYQVVSQIACVSCSSLTFATGSAANTTGTIMCQGTY